MADSGDKQDLKEKIIEALKTCYDPEIPVNIYDLGLIYEINDDGNGNVNIKMTLTSPACPIAGALVDEVKIKVGNVPGVKQCSVDLVWNPPWNPSLMSDEAKLELGMM